MAEAASDLVARVVIAFVHHSYHGDISGVSTWLVPFVRSLVSSGEDVACLLHQLWAGSGPTPMAGELAAAGALVSEERRPAYMEDATQSVLRFLGSVKPEIFLPQCLPEGFYGARISGARGLPWVMTMHSDAPDYWGALEAVRPAACGGSVVAVSQEIARLVIARQPECSVAAIPYGVRIPEETASWSEGEFTLVFSGRVIEEQKRFSLVLATMIEACRVSPRVRCKVLGDGPSLAAARADVERAGLAERIDFMGRVDVTRVEVELLSAQAVLLMSDYEGLPVALLEAMARGVVPVARAIPSGVSELVLPGQTGVLLSDDPVAAAKQICSLVEAPDVWARLSKESRHLVYQSYSQEVCFQRWLDLIRGRRLDAAQATRVCIPRGGKLPTRSPLIPDYMDQRKPLLSVRMLAMLRRCVGKANRKVRGLGGAMTEDPAGTRVK